MKIKKLEKIFLKNEFTVYYCDNSDIELGTWTNGGVNMIISLQEFSVNSFKEYVESFDIDEEIDLHRQGKDYKNAFTITESVKDFTDFEKRLKRILKKLINMEANDKYEESK